MCGRFTSTETPDKLMHRFGVIITKNLRPRWNVAPSQSATVIIRDGLHNAAISAEWGLRPPGGTNTMLINARMETANGKPTFSDAFLHSRCIVVASGWYEWSASKTPWYVQLCDGGAIAFGGLLFGLPEQQRFVIITTRADAGLADIHHRAPLVLAANNFDAWVGSDVSAAAALLRPAPATWFNWYRVGAEVGKVSQDHHTLMTPLTEEALRPQAALQGDLFA